MGVSAIGVSPIGGSPIGGSPKGGGPCSWAGGQFSSSFYLLQQTNISSNKIKWIQMIMSIVHPLILFRSPLSIVIWASHFCFWRNVPQIEAGNFWAILYLSTVEQQQSPLGLVDRYVDQANPCFAILGEQNLELCSWCCAASISPAALWHHPQRSCEGENKNISLEGGHPVKQ